MSENDTPKRYPELTIYGKEDGGAIVIERSESGEVLEYDANVAVYHLTAEQFSKLWDIDGSLNEARGTDKQLQEWREDRSAIVLNVTDQQALAGYDG